MHSRHNTTADALHQAALNVKNTNNLATDVRHAELQPSVATTTSTTGPVFHEQPRDTMTTTTTGMGMASGNMSKGIGMGQPMSKTTMTVDSVTRDAQAQIDAQVAEALAKSRALNAQDQARLQASIGSATSNLEEQARQLKKQIDEEKLRAEADVKRTQQEKLSATAQRQSMEEKAILEAAAARKIELEQKSLKLQQEIEEITRRKTAEMMSEKPGNLQFVHQHQDTAVKAQLAGDIGHALDIQKSGRVTETTTGGEVQYHPVQVQTMSSGTVQEARAAEQTIQGAAVHQQQGGMLHAMKTAVTGTRAYDEQSQWATQSDKLASK